MSIDDQCLVLVLSLNLLLVAPQLVNIQSLQTTIEHHFSRPRHSEVQRSYYSKFLTTTFKNFGLQTHVQDLISLSNEHGANIIGIFPGRKFNTTFDRPSLLGAHYDTVESSNGVDDNGSGVAALLETIRVLSSIAHICTLEYSVIFVAFDLEEQGFLGSTFFVSDWLLPYLNERNITDHFQGAIILDSIMNYDPFPTAQGLHENFHEMFPQAYARAQKDYFMGNFVQLTARSRSDEKLASIFSNSFKYTSHHPLYSDLYGEPWLMQLDVPLDNSTDKEAKLRYIDFTRSDHRSFWFHDAEALLPCILLSDSEQPAVSCPDYGFRDSYIPQLGTVLILYLTEVLKFDCTSQHKESSGVI